MSDLGDAHDALFLAATDTEKDEAITRYYQCVQRQVWDEVLDTLALLAEEIKSHETAHVTVLLAETRLRFLREETTAGL